MRRALLLLFCFVSAAVAVSPAQTAAAAPSQINVTDAHYGAGCSNPADPTGRLDSTCAIRAAVTAAESSGLPGAGYPSLYFPHGRYKVAGEGYTSAITLTKAVSIEGAGENNTVLVNTSPHAATLTYTEAGDCSGMPLPCTLSVTNIAFTGLGHATSGGLIEVDSTINGSMRNVELSETGGIALNLQGSSERWFFTDMEISHARWPVVLEGDTNENYFQRVNVINSGQTQDYCYSVNCPHGKLIASGVWRPDPHSAVFLDGENVHWTDSSIKSTNAIGGIRLALGVTSVTNTYIEGYPYDGQPRFNHAIAAPGPVELGHTTSAISATALSIPVDDAGWQPLYVNNPAQAKIDGRHSYVNSYGIFPADYLYGSRDPSRAVPGIARGTMEFVTVAAFSGDGEAHLLARGKNPIAWPAGSVIEQGTTGGYGVLGIHGNHLNSTDPPSSPKYSSGCSDTAQLTDWVSSPSELCAEIIAGWVPDGYMVPLPTQNYVHGQFSLDLSDNAIYTGGSEQDGAGWIKVPGNADVFLGGPSAPLTASSDPDTALHSYMNGDIRVQILQWPGTKPVSAGAYLVDPAAGVSLSTRSGVYSANIMRNGSLSHESMLNGRMTTDTPTH
jgi:hypothetical protein